MNTNQIRKFATEARVRLLKGVSNSLRSFFRENGEPVIEPKPVQGGCAFGEQIKDEAFLRQWQSLHHQISLHSFRGVVEQVAYTWFNRFLAINILAKNNLAEPMLQFGNPALRVPYIVEQARAGHFPEMPAADMATLRELLNNDALTFEQFSLLIGCYCTANPIIRRCFGRVDDYSFLLLPSNILGEGEIVDMLNRSDLITDDDYRSPELIGWLYQFYISERKDEVYAKKGKFETDEIPAATQIFTPNWIVKYMVQNSLGRIYLDNEPYSELKSSMQYLVGGAVSHCTDTNDIGGAVSHCANNYQCNIPCGETPHLLFTDVRELTCADLACGSGHILNECFDLLYDIYIEQGYSRRDAVENIFAHNLIGIDIDTRAKQLATFALLLKACRRDATFADAHAMPRVLDMPEPYRSDIDLRDTLRHFFLGGTPTQIDETAEAIALFDHAEDLGSIMRFNLSPGTREAIVRRLAEYRASDIHTFDDLFPYFDVILALTDKYAAVVMNPPYMKAANMNVTLSEYVKENYADGKGDLCTVFMLMQADKTAKNGYYGNIVPPSWMFLPTFEGLRNEIISNQSIQSLLHLSRGVFGADFGSVSCVIQNVKSGNATGTYFRLIERTFQEFDQKHLQMLFEKTLENHDFKYYFADYTKDVEDIVYSDKGAKIYYPNISQSNFAKIPGSPIGYWVNEKIEKAFEVTDIKKICTTRCGLATGDNDHYIRLWTEIAFNGIGFNYSREDAKTSNIKWFPYNNAGGSRKWYGLNDSVINWYDDGYEMQTKLDPTGKRIWAHNFNLDKIFIEHGGWSDISSKGNFFRFYPKGYLFTSNAVFADEQFLPILIGYGNSKFVQSLIGLLNPTMHFTPGNFNTLPFEIEKFDSPKIRFYVEDCISISKEDWDAHETSWDFKENELVRIFNDNGWGPVENVVSEYKSCWERKFNQLHANEEELNRQFIEIYGLQDELTPDVPLDEITILQQGEIHIENNDIVWHNDVIAKQLISYAIGCWMGRYRLDKPGLHIAHPNPTAEEVCTYTYNGSELEIDDDGIIPILRADSSFADNACHRVRDFLRIAFGEENLLENINFIETCLGKSIEAYFMKDFWKDHKKMYQNRPIYWLFSSKKGAFQCIAYMHRMDAYTVERVRSKYLLPHMDWLTHRINELRADDAMLTTAQRKTAERLEKELAECREYHERLHYVADRQIAFDLDDGVVVNYAKFGDVLAKIK